MSRTLREVLAGGARVLAAAGVAGPARDARLLLAGVLGLEAGRLALEPERVLGAGEAARYEAAIAARAAGKPVSRILGRRAFWGRDFRITPDVLDPRPETETLIEAALALGPAGRLLDLGTGSGIIAVTLLCEWPEARALATDLSAACLDVAAENAARHGVGARLALRQADWFAGLTGGFGGRFGGRFGLIVSNPPYIRADEMAGLAREVREHDPALALSPGGDGLGAYRAIAAGLGAHLAPGGHVLLEIGPEQGGAVAALLASAGLEAIRVLPDLDGRDRVVAGQMPG